MKSFIPIFFLTYFSTFAQAQINATLANQLNEILESSVNESGDHGVSAYLIMPDGSEWNGTAGVGKDNISITDTTLFHGASTTKFNIALLVLLLEEDGLVDLDQSWSKYISLDLKFDTLITVRHLLNHTSGIADYLETGTSGVDILADFNYFYTPAFILENIVDEDSSFPVGSSFQYSNSNYVLAALIAATVTGNPVHVELRNRIWDPLNMKHTYFGGHESYSEPTAGVWWNFGNSLTDYSNEPTTSMLTYAYGAGNIVSCPQDLAILLDAFIHDQILSNDSKQEMLNFVPASFNSWTAGYGLGLHHLSGINDDMVIGHDGYYTNLTDMFYSSKHDFTLVTMSNSQTEWLKIYKSMYDVITNHIASTSLSEPEESTFIISPNPAINQCFINSMDIIDEIIVRDIFGVIHFHAFANDFRVLIPLKTSGTYFITVRSGGSLSTSMISAI